MSRTARRERPLAKCMASRILAQGIRNRALWPMAAAGLIVLLGPAAAAPEGVASAVARAPARLILAQADTAKPAASSTDAKPGQKAKSETKPVAKAANKPAKEKTAAQPTSKPAPAKAAGALAPPLAAALKPVLPNEDGAAPAAPSAAAPQPQAIPAPANTIVTAAAIDVSAVKRAIEMVRNRKQTDASELKKNISDPAAKKVVEWVILRSDDSGVDFSRYVAFIA